MQTGLLRVVAQKMAKIVDGINFAKPDSGRADAPKDGTCVLLPSAASETTIEAQRNALAGKGSG
jgi:hypothetical protein